MPTPVLTPLDEVILKFWAVGYAGLDERERRILAYGYTAASCHCRPIS